MVHDISNLEIINGEVNKQTNKTINFFGGDVGCIRN